MNLTIVNVGNSSHQFMAPLWEPSLEELLVHFTHINKVNNVEFTKYEELNLEEVIYNFQEKAVKCMHVSLGRDSIESLIAPWEGQNWLMSCLFRWE